jgi:hypothetical protein
MDHGDVVDNGGRVSSKGSLWKKIISLPAFNANHKYGRIDANFYLL